jgi:rhamnopyranosyl-N-acetylglucosaminyl-diphospho-decaprenol beta-1,3/1,4-galactofuranosyltransferase
MIKSVGLPDSRLFIRGDEQEYLLRIKKKGFQIATATEVAIIHPSGEDELYPTLFGLLRIPIPHTPFKLSHQIRNRGYITRKFRRWDWFIIDVIRYVSFFFFRKKPQLAAAKVLLSLYSLGLKGRIHSDCPIIETETWIAIQNLILTRPVGDPK